MAWLTPTSTDGEVSDYRFRLDNGTPSGVPGVAWIPSEAAELYPLVLLGHGGSGHKRSDRIVRLGRWFALHARVAAIAIDGPFHGDRVPSPLSAREYFSLIADEGIEVVVDRMISDWHLAVTAFGESGLVDAGILAYLGLSMGTRYGLPFAASAGPALRCAVFGKFGLEQSPALPADLDMADLIRTAARSVTAPTLFHSQTDDELFPLDGQLALFELLAARDKTLLSFPGRHGETDPAAVASWCDFVARHLRPE